MSVRFPALLESRHAPATACLLVTMALSACDDEPAAPTPVAPLIGLEISADTIPFDSVELVRDGQIRLAATLIREDARLPNPLSLTWTSSDPEVAAVDEEGVLSALSTGTTQIIATAADQVDTAVVVVTTVNFVALSGGGGAYCGLSENGRAFCWGLATGNAILPTSTFPVPVDGGLRFSDIDVGNWVDMCGVSTAGAVYCWNTSGPERFDSEESFTSISLGGSHACAVNIHGEIYCWGSNWAGQLGDGTTAESVTPTRVTAGDAVFVEVSAARDHTCALEDTGVAYCWGDNNYGQLGTGTDQPGSSAVPVQAAPGHLFKRIVVGYHDYTCGITLNDDLLCWAHNDLAQLGRGFRSREEFQPASPSGLTTAKGAHGYVGHTCAVALDGSGHCWGVYASNGQLGDGRSTASMVPVRVLGDLEFQTIQTASGSSCGLTTGGQVYCWGWNLGVGPDDSNSAEPVLLAGPQRP